MFISSNVLWRMWKRHLFFGIFCARLCSSDFLPSVRNRCRCLNRMNKASSSIRDLILSRKKQVCRNDILFFVYFVILRLVSRTNRVECETRSGHHTSRPFYVTIDWCIVPDYRNHLHQRSDWPSCASHLGKENARWPIFRLLVISLPLGLFSLNGHRKFVAFLKLSPTVNTSWTRSSIQMMSCLPRDFSITVLSDNGRRCLSTLPKPRL